MPCFGKSPSLFYLFFFFLHRPNPAPLLISQHRTLERAHDQVPILVNVQFWKTYAGSLHQYGLLHGKHRREIEKKNRFIHHEEKYKPLTLS